MFAAASFFRDFFWKNFLLFPYKYTRMIIQVVESGSKW